MGVVEALVRPACRGLMRSSKHALRLRLAYVCRFRSTIKPHEFRWLVLDKGPSKLRQRCALLFDGPKGLPTPPNLIYATTFIRSPSRVNFPRCLLLSYHEFGLPGIGIDEILPYLLSESEDCRVLC